MPQAQETIPLVFLDGPPSVAGRTGNNAAWVCRCGGQPPLVGFSDTTESESTSTVVVCPGCDRHYRVVASRLRGPAERVQELRRAW